MTHSPCATEIYTGQWLGVHRHGEGTLLRQEPVSLREGFLQNPQTAWPEFLNPGTLKGCFESEELTDKARG